MLREIGIYLGLKWDKLKWQLGDKKSGTYYSQHGQDKLLAEKIFPQKRNGIFVDIGANDGIAFSNTYFLEQIGWNGLVIEPIPSVYEALVENRRCITINGCIAPRSGKGRFRVITGYSQMLSGLVDEYDPRHLKRIERELSSNGGSYEDVEVDCYKLDELLEKHGIAQVDYLSIDVEGAEFDILNSIDFAALRIDVVSVENNYLDARIPELLSARGFEFHTRVGVDFFYINARKNDDLQA